MEQQRKRYDTHKYQWRKGVTLTPTEGAAMEELYAKCGCENISQFCKKILHGQITLSGINVEVVQPKPVCTKEELQALQAVKRKYESICRIINT